MLFEKRNHQNDISSQVTISKWNPHHLHISVWILLHGPIVCLSTFDVTTIIIFSAALYLKTPLSISPDIVGFWQLYDINRDPNHEVCACAPSCITK